jgi:glycerol-3-phosphate O-acyltransferase
MSSVVTLPLWLLVLLCLFAGWAALGSLLIPSVRWYLRRRVSRVIDELNTRLQLKIQPFKLTKRQVLIDRLIYDPEVIKAAEAHATENSLRREEVMSEVGRYAREIVPSFNAYAYFRIAYWAARWSARLLYRVRLAYSDNAGLSHVDPNASVVFIMNHRSNMDYILVAYLAATRSALSYAVGEWARIWPLQTLIKSMGAYFIRRNSANPLYRKVLARYVHMATEGGVVQAVYPEGRLSRDGKLQPLKLGLISYMVSDFDPHGERDLVFVPVGINYDRVLEDRSLVRRLNPKAEKKSASYVVATILKFIFHNINLMIRRRWYRFGYAGVNFGTPISLREYLARRKFDFRSLEKERLFAEVESFGRELIDAVGRVIPVLPVSMVATVILRNEGKQISELELKAAVLELIRELENTGAQVYIPRRDQEYAVAVGLRMLTLRRLVVEKDGLFMAKPEELAILRYYANAISHLFARDSVEKVQ